MQARGSRGGRGGSETKSGEKRVNLSCEIPSSRICEVSIYLHLHRDNYEDYVNDSDRDGNGSDGNGNHDDYDEKDNDDENDNDDNSDDDDIENGNSNDNNGNDFDEFYYHDDIDDYSL